MKTNKKKLKHTKKRRKTDWRGLKDIVTAFLLISASIIIIIQNAQIRTARAFSNQYRQQVQLALSLYSDAQKTQNALYIDDVNCMSQLTNSDMIQIKLLR